MPEKAVMTSKDIQRSLTRIAHEILEKNQSPDTVVLAGIHTRGVPLAKRLAGVISTFENATIQTIGLDIGPYRDDQQKSGVKQFTRNPDHDVSINGKNVILIDDVLFTGRSVRAAMDALIDRGRPLSIQLAVLVDRGHRELPIKADYVGKNIPSARHEDIQVKLVETDGIDIVVIQENEKNETANMVAGRTF
ncbi:MAG: bifunctional pyr operon transcriptional regulator/uracil phosphoribosyltransferase PyrR [Dehalococcoidales bacterium]|nr:bifunctional pyr operon transcriptional regulator/uracil phosphoribosyltransferase PyrR [Dehalococcoidales bacterium]